MKKILAIIAATMTIIAALTGCDTFGINSGQQQTQSGNSLVGTWTGTDPDGAIIKLTFTDATTATGVATYGGQVLQTLKITYSMTDAANGSGTVIMTNPNNGKVEVATFTIVFISGELYVTTEDWGTIKFTKDTNTNTNPGGNTNQGGNTGSSLVGTTWKWSEDEEDEFILLSFSTASTGTGSEYDEGQLCATFNFTYTMTDATNGSGSFFVTDYYGSVTQVPFTFTVIGSDLYLTGASYGERAETYHFKKVG